VSSRTRSALESGRRAELAVADYLFALGHRIVGRNVRVGRLELDIVARKGPLLAVVEVRTRGPGAFVGAFASVGGAKRARLRRAVEELWRTRAIALSDVERVRIDVAAVTFTCGSTHVEYVEGAVSA
jgi:putative endonuclease